MRDAPLDEGTLRASGTAAVYVDGKAVARQGTQEVAGSFGLSQGEVAELEGRFGRRPGKSSPQPEPGDGRSVIEGGAANAIVGEVGFDTPYALAQHERLDFHHPKGGKAKYLQANLEAQASRYQENLRDRIREALA